MIPDKAAGFPRRSKEGAMIPDVFHSISTPSMPCFFIWHLMIPYPLKKNTCTPVKFPAFIYICRYLPML